MEVDFTTEIGAEAMVLAAVIGVLVQQLKLIPYIVKLKTHFPVFVVCAMLMGIGLSYQQGIENPIIAGIMIGLMASGAYSAAKNGHKK